MPELGRELGREFGRKLGPKVSPDSQVAALRACNRLYTRKIGVVDGIASSPFSLAEARVLYELAHREQPTVTDIRKELGLDAGYLSRILRNFERRKFLTRQPSKTDERQRVLSLTAQGWRAFAPPCASTPAKGTRLTSAGLPRADRLSTIVRWVQSFRAEPDPTTDEDEDAQSHNGGVRL